MKKQLLYEGMTAEEVVYKKRLKEQLASEGFVTYAKYLDYFHINLTTSAEWGQPFAAAMLPDRGIIYINRNIYNRKAISLLIRHEILHQVMYHNKRFLNLMKARGIETPSALKHNQANFAADYEISIQGYDNDDKQTAKHIAVDGQTFEGLVMEYDYPENSEYWNMSFEEIFEMLDNDDRFKEPPPQPEQPQQPQPEPTEEFIKGWQKLIDDYNSGKFTKEELEDFYNRVIIPGGDF